MKTSIKQIILCGMLLAVSTTACVNDETEKSTDGNKTAVQISANTPATRATDNSWGENDAIGITMLKAGSANVIAPYNNYKYITTDGSSSFKPATADQIAYFPVDGSEVTFKAYYPYNSKLSADMAAAVSVKDQNSLPDLDLMTAEHTAGTSKETPDVKLHFYHRLAKVMLNLTTEDNSISLEGCKVVVKGLKTAGSYNIMNETLAIDANSTADIAIPIHKGKGEAIFLPRQAGTGVTFQVTATDGGIYTAILKDDVAFSAGYKHTLHIKLMKTPVMVSATIEEWMDGPETHSNVIRLVTGLKDSENVKEGDTLRLFLKDQADYAHAATFTYNADGQWKTTTPLYWDNITANPALFIGTAVIDGKLNDTQMDDVLVSKESTVSSFTGINLELQHVGAKTVVTLKSTDKTFSEKELAGAVITFPGYKNTGSVDAKGQFVIGEGTKDITAKDGVAIFPPQTIKKGDIIAVIKINGRNYEVKADDKNFDFEKGVAKKLTVNLSKTEAKISTKIIPWDNVEAEFSYVRVVTELGDNENINEGNELRLFLKDEADYTHATTFTYSANGGWTSTAPIYWNDITASPAHFIGTAVIDAKLNDTQMDDILISKETATDAYTGVNLELEHAGAKAIVELKSASGTFSTTELAKATITFPGYKNTGSVDAKGQFVIGEDTKDITAENGVAIFPPQTIQQGGVIAIITINNRKYEIKAEGKIFDFAKATAQKLIVDISKTEVKVSTKIIPWAEDTKNFSYVRIVTDLEENLNVKEGNKLNLFLKDQGSDHALAATFTYNVAKKEWATTTPIYWNNITANPASFIGSAVIDTKLNETQMDDILLSDETNTSQYKGVNLALKHAGAKAIVELKSTGNTFSPNELAGATITFPGYKNTGNVDAKGQFVIGEGIKDITTKNGVAIFPPQAIQQGGVIAIIKINGRSYEVKAEDSNFNFVQGVAKKLIIDLSKTEAKISTKIVDWTEEKHDFSDVRIGKTNLTANSGNLVNNDKLYIYTGDATNRTQQGEYFTYNSTGNSWSYSSAANPLHWENMPTTGHIYASITRPAISVDATNNQLPDYITAAPIVNNGGTDNTALNFEMKHAVAKVIVVLKSKTYTLDQLKAATVLLPNYKTGAILNKAVFVPGTTTADIKLPKFAKDAANTYVSDAAYLQPQDVAASNVLVKVTLSSSEGNRVYEAKKSEIVKYEAGKATTLIITLEKSNVQISTNVIGWTDKPEISFDDVMFFTLGSSNADGFNDKDKIGFHKIGSDGKKTESNTGTVSISGSSKVINLTDPWYRDDFAAGNKVLAVYPKQDIANGSDKFDFSSDFSSDGTNADTKDLMTAVASIGANTNVAFSFKHALSKVTVNIFKGTGFNDSEFADLAVAMNNFKLSGSVAVTTGVATATGTAKETFMPAKLSNPNNVGGKTAVASYQALIMPQTIAATSATKTKIVTVTLNRQSYLAEVSANAIFEAGKNHVYNITLNKTGISLSATVAPWDIVSGGNITIE